MPLFIIISVVSIICVAFSASLVAHFQSGGRSWPSASIRDRVRLLLVAAVWESVFGRTFSSPFHSPRKSLTHDVVYCLIGVLVAPASIAFGILVHLVTNLIGFFLFLVGAAALTAITNNKSCSQLDFDRCNVVKGLVVISWIDTVFIFAALILILTLGFMARSGAGIRRGALTDA